MSTPRTIIVHAGALLALTGFCTTAFAQFNFDPAANTGVGTQPSGVAAGDFDGDGDVDLATTVDNPDRVIVLINNGSGAYAMGPATFLPNSSSPQDLVAGDFDGDLDMDLAIALRDPSGTIQIMTNTGAGSFTQGASVAVGDRPRGLSVGDIDGDGDPDIAVANRDANSASVLRNNGGAFIVSTLAIGGETRDTTFGDFDADGDLDLAVSDSDNRRVRIYTNTGGSFSFSADLGVGPFTRPEGVATADVNGDGRTDLVTAISDQTFAIHQAAVFLNSMTGFTGWTGYNTSGTNPSDIVTGDFDCDGDMDMAVTNSDSNTLSLLSNNGAGTYGAPQLSSTGLNPGRPVAADLDGDGDADIAVDNRDTNDISVYINQTCAAGLTGDANGDGVVDFADILEVIANWGPCTGCAADINGDGQVSFADVLEVIANWS